MNAALQTCVTAPPDDSQGRESRPANRCNDENPLESEVSLQRASLTLRAIRQRCETGHDAHPDSRFMACRSRLTMAIWLGSQQRLRQWKKQSLVVHRGSK
jgi:hypothetical protein